MRQSEPTIFTGWWDFGVRACALLTTPRADVDRCDRDLEALARASVAGKMVHAASVATRRAWMASRTRAVARSLGSTLLLDAGAVSWRVGGWMIAVTGATVLVAERFGTFPNGPLAWVVPALLVLVGLSVMALAAPLARAAADRRSSDSHEA